VWSCHDDYIYVLELNYTEALIVFGDVFYRPTVLFELGITLPFLAFFTAAIEARYRSPSALRTGLTGG
jgi:hypothetical protein